MREVVPEYHEGITSFGQGESPGNYFLQEHTGIILFRVHGYMASLLWHTNLLIRYCQAPLYIDGYVHMYVSYIGIGPGFETHGQSHHKSETESARSNRNFKKKITMTLNCDIRVFAKFSCT